MCRSLWQNLPSTRFKKCGSEGFNEFPFAPPVSQQKFAEKTFNLINDFLLSLLNEILTNQSSKETPVKKVLEASKINHDDESDVVFRRHVHPLWIQSRAAIC